jgi:hypothetical protein
MNDYLWDRKGEPDAEVARLEALLGTFKHEPRTLSLPADAAPEPKRAKLLPFAPRLRASRLFAPAALAAAAALVVASVFVASALLRARTANESERASAPAPSKPKGEQPAQSQPERAMLEPPPGPGEVQGAPPATVPKLKDEKVKDEKVTVGTLPHVARRRKEAQADEVQPASARGRQQRDSNAEAVTGTPGLSLEAMTTRAGASSLVENARLLTKEQLVYALRFTGAKLRDMRQKAQGATQNDER